MRLRNAVKTLSASALAFGLLAAAPALAQDHGPATDADGRVFSDSYPVDTRPEWRGGPPVAQPGMPMPPMGHPPMMGQPMGHPPIDARYEQARADWLSECRRNHRGRDRDGGLGGAAIGGVVGGVIGNRVAGSGDRVVGTIAGAAVGAVAGAAIDRADGSGRERVGDWCERYLEQYSGGYGQAGYGYAAPMVMMVPVMMVQQQQQAQPCTETITTTEYVTVAPRRAPARRVIYRPAPDKRVRIAPAPSGKRVRM
jgi:hypothetical protein